MTEKEYDEFMRDKHLESAIINLTNQCPLRCTYCFEHHNKREMSLQTAKDIVLFLLEQSENQHVHICFFGGEPMLKYDEIIVPLVNWVKENKYNISFGMTTNGVLLNTSRLSWLRDNDIQILLSIDGEESVQNDQRPYVDGRPSFQNIPLQEILQFFPNTTFRSTVTARNVNKIYDNYLFVRNTGFRNYFFTPDQGDNWNKQHFAIIRDEFIKIIMNIIYDKQNYNQYLLPSNWKIQFRNVKSSDYEILNTCGMGIKSCGIDTNGDIYACQEHSTYGKDDNFYIGNIYSGIDKNKHLIFFNDYLKDKLDTKCENCIYSIFCKDNTCHSSNYNNHKRFRMPTNIFCMWERLQINAFLYLRENNIIV